jgi:hypothetical protein
MRINLEIKAHIWQRIPIYLNLSMHCTGLWLSRKIELIQRIEFAHDLSYPSRMELLELCEIFPNGNRI